MNLHGQIELQFSFEYKESIKSPIETSVLLKFPDGRISKLYSDTKTNTISMIKNILLHKENIFFQSISALKNTDKIRLFMISS